MQKVEPAQQRSRKKEKTDKLKILRSVFHVVGWLGKFLHVINYVVGEISKLMHHFS